MDAVNSIINHFSEYTLLQILWTISGLILLAYSLYRGFSRRSRNGDNDDKKLSNLPASGKLCNSPDCVRCNRYIAVLGTATDRLFQYLESHANFGETDREPIQNIINTFATDHTSGNEIQKPSDDLQKPTMYFLPHLVATPVWSTNEFKKDLKLICENIEALWKDFSQVYKKMDTRWTVNNTPKGIWSVFYLYNQGKVQLENCRDCPQTASLLDMLPSFMKNCVFCNAGFSVIHPGTDIEEHHGPTNTRIRCHIGLQIPSDSFLEVAGERLHWKEGEVMLFDDSYAHSAHHHGNRKSPPRAIFLLDFWHPQLTLEERDILSFIFAAEQ